MKRKYLAYAILAIVVVALLGAYHRYVCKTKITTLNIPVFTVKKFIRSNDNSFVQIENVELDEVEDIMDFDMVLVRVHGDSMNKTYHEAIKHAI